MKCVLCKEIVSYKDKNTKEEKKLTNFYLQMENGERIRIKANSWVDKDKKNHSNNAVLSALATDVSKLPF